MDVRRLIDHQALEKGEAFVGPLFVIEFAGQAVAQELVPRLPLQHFLDLFTAGGHFRNPRVVGWNKAAQAADGPPILTVASGGPALASRAGPTLLVFCQQLRAAIKRRGVEL